MPRSQDPDRPDRGFTPLIAFAKAGDADGVARELAGGATAMVDQRTEDGWSAVQWATSSGHVDVVSLLVAHKADVLQTDLQGANCLHILTRSPNCTVEAVAHMVREFKMDVETKSGTGSAPLLPAVTSRLWSG
jgi:hypothetical protein